MALMEEEVLWLDLSFPKLFPGFNIVPVSSALS